MTNRLTSYQLMTEKETAALLKISVAKLQQDRFYGVGIKFVRLNRAVRYRLDDIIAFIEANTKQSTSEE